MTATLKELKNGKWALIGERDYLIKKMSEESRMTPMCIDDLKALVEPMVKFAVVEATKALTKTFSKINESPQPQLSLSLPQLTLAPSGDVNELRTQIHHEVSALAARLNKNGKNFAWNDAYKIYYQKRGYDVKAHGKVAYEGKNSTYLNRFEADGKLADLLRVLQEYLY